MTRWREALQTRTFDERLAAFLDDLRVVTGARALVLLWADVRDRILSRRVQHATPDGAAVLGTVVDDDAASALAASTGAEELRVRPIRIGVPLLPNEACLVAFGGTDVPAEALDALGEALSVERRTNLARAVLAGFDHAYDAMELTDGDVRLLHVNRAWESLFDYTRDEVVGRFPTFLRAGMENIHDAAFYRFAEETTTRGEHWRGVLMSHARNGTRVVQEATVSRFPDQGAGIAGNLAVRHELGAREARDRALARVQLEFRSVLTELPVPVAVLREDVVYFGNPAFFLLLDRIPDAVIGRSLSEFVVAEDAQLACAAPTAEARTVRVLRPDGSVRLAELSGAGAVSFEGQASRIMLVRDSTDERVASEREAHASRLAALGTLSASVAHEINTPLAYVLANLEALTGSDAAELEAVREAMEGARRIERIIADLGAFSRLGEQGDEREPVDLERAVTVAINLAANRLRHTAEVERFHEPGVRAYGRETQLVQVFVNLLVNAAHAVENVPPERRRIELRTSSGEEGTVLVEVTDHGAGVPEHALRHIFEPFFTTRADAGGSGLGLSVSRRIVEGFGGQIQVTSTPGSGACFLITLQRAPAHVETSATLPPKSAPRAGRRARLLVVDDEPAVGRALTRLLSEYDVEVATSGTEALTRLRLGTAPDVVLCDLMMPGMTGQELFEVVRRELPDVSSRFVFLTGGTFTDAANAFIDTHRDRLLAKPFSRDKVRAVLAQFAPDP